MIEQPTTEQKAWRVIGASVTGTSHLRQERGCEDVHAYQQIGDDFLCLVAADGAGTASQAAWGALKAVQTTLSTAILLFCTTGGFEQEEQVRQTAKEMLTLVRQTIESSVMSSHANEAAYLPSSSFALPLREFATTLLCAIVTKHWLVTLQIGDGAIVIQRNDDRLESLSSPSTNEYINETQFLTDDDFLTHVTYTVLARKDIRCIALLTDGLQMLAMHYPTNTPFLAFFAPLFTIAAQADTTEDTLQRFLTSARINARTDDDKTLVIAVRQVQS